MANPEPELKRTPKSKPKKVMNKTLGGYWHRITEPAEHSFASIYCRWIVNESQNRYRQSILGTLRFGWNHVENPKTTKTMQKIYARTTGSGVLDRESSENNMMKKTK